MVRPGAPSTAKAAGLTVIGPTSGCHRRLRCGALPARVRLRPQAGELGAGGLQLGDQGLGLGRAARARDVHPEAADGVARAVFPIRRKPLTAEPPENIRRRMFRSWKAGSLWSVSTAAAAGFQATTSQVGVLHEGRAEAQGVQHRLHRVGHRRGRRALRRRRPLAAEQEQQLPPSAVQFQRARQPFQRGLRGRSAASLLQPGVPGDAHPRRGRRPPRAAVPACGGGPRRPAERAGSGRSRRNRPRVSADGARGVAGIPV